MSSYIVQNKKAWEYNAYEFWNKQSGTPTQRAKKDMENPIKSLKKYAKYFDTFMHSLLKENGKMICSDFHPYTKIEANMDYFSTDVFEGEMAHAPFFPDEIRNQMPKCSYRKYTISEIINATINAGFTIERFDEHPAWKNEVVPGEFTVIARR